MSAISGFCEKCNKFRKRHCDGNRNTCMSILFDTIEALQQENEQLKDENISIRKWNKCVDEDYPKLLEENKRLQYTLIGVMHSVDKWLDDTDGMDEVNRAAQAREIALQAIEKRDEALKVAMEALAYFANSSCRYCGCGNGSHAYDCSVFHSSSSSSTCFLCRLTCIVKVKEALVAIDKAIGGKEDV